MKEEEGEEEEKEKEVEEEESRSKRRRYKVLKMMVRLFTFPKTFLLLLFVTLFASLIS